MKRLYCPNGDTYTFDKKDDKLFYTLFGNEPMSAEEPRSCSIPTPTPTNRTKDYYTEQNLARRKTGTVIAVLREGKLETLNKLPHPFTRPPIPAGDLIKQTRKAHSNPSPSEHEKPTDSKPAPDRSKRPRIKARTPQPSKPAHRTKSTGSLHPLQKVRKKSDHKPKQQKPKRRNKR